MSIADDGAPLERRVTEVVLAAGRSGLTRAALRDAVADQDDDAFARALEHLEGGGSLVRWARRYYALQHSDWRIGRLQRVRRHLAVVHTDDSGAAVTFNVLSRDLAGARAGDRVLVRPLPRPRGRRPAREHEGPGAVVVRVLKRGHTRMVGRLQRERGRWRLRSWDRGQAVDAGELEIEDRGDLGDRLWVVVEIVSGERERTPRARVLEQLGRDGQPGVDVRVVLRHHQIPEKFPAEVVKAAAEQPRAIDPEELRRRHDLRQRCVITIDGADSRDFDDAISVESTPEGFRIAIHVADVAHYVPLGGALDREARRRGTSVYFPERAIHMLPDALSEDLCSLRPDLDRLAVTVEAELDRSGELLRSTVFESVIRSRQRLTYTAVEELFRNRDNGVRPAEGTGEGDGALFDEPVCELLFSAREIARQLHRRRLERGALDFDLPTSELEVDERGEIVEYRAGHRLESHRLIEELMVLANSIVAQRLATPRTEPERSAATLFRVHLPPPAEDLSAIESVAREIGRWRGEAALSPLAVGKLLTSARDTEHSGLLTLLTMRALQRAVYQQRVAPHYALALEAYCHFTSPIRRYPDLVMHRRLKGAVASEGESGEQLAAEQSRLERRAETAELELRHWRKLRFLEDKIGFTYHGRISGVQDFGIFVLLDELQVDGMVPISSLGDDEYDLEPERHCLVGRRKGRCFRLGDRIDTVIVEVLAERRRLVLGVVGMRLNPRSGSRDRGRRGAGRRPGTSRHRRRS